MRRTSVSVVVALALLACLGYSRPTKAPASTPDLLRRTDWAGDEVVQAPTAGGPEVVPDRLSGDWRVSLCVKEGLHRGHAWIRYENVRTGEVHTIGRFQKNVRPTRRRSTGELLYPRTKVSGLHWDYDWRYEHEVRQGEYIVESVYVRDPWIFEHDDPYGHRTLRDNCVTYARDAWEYYSGQRYELSLVHTPEGFLHTIERASEGRAAESAALRRLPPVQ